MHDNEVGDHYVPPEPPPIKFNDPVTGALLCGVIGAPMVFVILGILLAFEPPLIGTLCVLVFIGCFVALVMRMGKKPRQDDGWDDGAVL